MKMEMNEVERLARERDEARARVAELEVLLGGTCAAQQVECRARQLEETIRLTSAELGEARADVARLRAAFVNARGVIAAHVARELAASHDEDEAAAIRDLIVSTPLAGSAPAPTLAEACPICDDMGVTPMTREDPLGMECPCQRTAPTRAEVAPLSERERATKEALEELCEQVRGERCGGTIDTLPARAALAAYAEVDRG